MALTVDSVGRGESTKIPLKNLAEKHYGRSFAHRKKMGFPLPVRALMGDRDLLGKYAEKVWDDDFLLHKCVSTSGLRRCMQDSRFDNRSLNYGGTDSQWLKWYLMVIRAAQDVFQINDVVD